MLLSSEKKAHPRSNSLQEKKNDGLRHCILANYLRHTGSRTKYSTPSFSQELHVHSAVLKRHSGYFFKFIESLDKMFSPSSQRCPFKYEYITKFDRDSTWSLGTAANLKVKLIINSLETKAPFLSAGLTSKSRIYASDESMSNSDRHLETADKMYEVITVAELEIIVQQDNNYFVLPVLPTSLVPVPGESLNYGDFFCVTAEDEELSWGIAQVSDR